MYGSMIENNHVEQMNPLLYVNPYYYSMIWYLFTGTWFNFISYDLFNCVHFAIVHVFMNYLSFCIELCFVFLPCILYYLNLKSSILCFLLFFIIMKYGSLAMIIMNMAYIPPARHTLYQNWSIKPLLYN